MKNVFAAAGAAAVVLTAGAAAAEGHTEQCFDKGTLTYFDCPTAEVDNDAFYIGARGGAAWLDSDFDLDAGVNVEQDYEVGYIITGMVGYKFADVAPGIDVRPELESGYLDGEVEAHSINGGADVPGSFGDTSVLFGFANLFVDLEVLAGVDLIVGGGVGFGEVDFDGHGIPGLVAMDDSDTGFGYNVGAGLGIEVAPDVKLEAMYRYMDFDVELTSTEPFTADADIDAHTATVGVRFEF